MIPDFRTYIGESVWADIHRRSNGAQERKEDDINSMDYEEFGNYILDNYEFLYNDSLLSLICKNGRDIGISIDFLKLDDNDNEVDYFIENGKKMVTVYDNVKELAPNLYDKLNQAYILDNVVAQNFNQLLSIKPREKREIDNRFYLEIIDFIIDNLDSEYRKLIDRK
jgi:hypothetical protein